MELGCSCCLLFYCRDNQGNKSNSPLFQGDRIIYLCNRNTIHTVCIVECSLTQATRAIQMCTPAHRGTDPASHPSGMGWLWPVISTLRACKVWNSETLSSGEITLVFSFNKQTSLRWQKVTQGIDTHLLLFGRMSCYCRRCVSHSN